MADLILTLPVDLRGGLSPILNQFPFPANTWQSVEMRMNSTAWNTLPGLTLDYSARVSIDGGVTWTSWGGLTAVSPTFMKDGVTKIEPGGKWTWPTTFNGGGILETNVLCLTAFNWGATITFHDATL